MPNGRQHLKLVRLPISPPPHSGELNKYSKSWESAEAVICASSSCHPLHPGGQSLLIGSAGGMGGLSGAVSDLVECRCVHRYSYCIRSEWNLLRAGYKWLW